jgi:acetoin utilization deacetylase AcuC-like enzyme
MPVSRMQLRSTTLSEASREAIRLQLDAIKAKIQEHLSLMNEHFESTSRRIEELENSYDGSDEADQAMDEAKKRAETIQASQVSCGVVFAQAESSRSGIDIGQVLTTDDSFAYVALPSSVVGKVNLRVGIVTTQRGSTSHVGAVADDLKL